ncbi:MAG: alpha/beta hydrolase [Gammaproteobacteria bacterium]|nr:alpha/beta hydrolase [Gammaproteobacteria bacterium]
MKKAMFAGLVALLAGCSSLPPAERLLEQQERELDTDGSTTMLFHSALYYPSEISLTFPGFILGIEKSPVDIIAKNGAVYIKEIPGSGFTKEELADEVIDKKILYVSHIIESFGKPYGQSNCVHYNAYYREGLNKPKPPIEFCNNSEKHEVRPEKAYMDSWLAMSNLKRLIRDRIESYTHVIVVTMGWNTVQEEAVRNFNSIMKNLKAASGDDPFNPLFIGVTWPSQWAAKWVEPIVRGLSFPWKAHDADEVGLTWLGVLLHETLADIDKPIVVIGHSFGARATSVAACIGPAIVAEETTKSENNNTIDYLINLQGAYRTNRLLGQHREGKLQYDNSCGNVKRIFLTSSVSDTAMDSLFWRKDKYAGDDESYDRYCENGNSEVRCGTAAWSGELTITNNVKSNVTYINADELINRNSYLSGGDAHSDIYRAEHGVMLWNMLSHSEE